MSRELPRIDAIRAATLSFDRPWLVPKSDIRFFMGKPEDSGILPMTKRLSSIALILNLAACSLGAPRGHEAPGAKSHHDLAQILSSIKTALSDGGSRFGCTASRYSMAHPQEIAEVLKMTDKNIIAVQNDASEKSAFFMLANERDKYSVSIKTRGRKCVEFEIHPVVD